MNYIIRKLYISDYEKYITLLNQFRPCNNTISREGYENILLNKIPNTTIWILEDIDTAELIGTISILYEYKLIYGGCIIGHIEDVCIHSKYRKLGLGTILIQKVIEEAKIHKCYKIVLNCMKEVLPFYISNGFEVRGCNCSILLEFKEKQTYNKI